jgi:hypothetical protein
VHSGKGNQIMKYHQAKWEERETLTLIRGGGLTDELPGTIQWISSSPPPQVNNASGPMIADSVPDWTNRLNPCNLSNFIASCFAAPICQSAKFADFLQGVQGDQLTLAVPSDRNPIESGHTRWCHLRISDPNDPKPRKDGKKLLLPAGLLAHQTPKSLLAESPPA